MAGRFAEAMDVVERAVARLGRQPILLEQLGRGYALLGRSGEARAVVAELQCLAAQRPLSEAYQAGVRAALGEEEAFRQALDRMYQQRSGRLAFIASEPGMAPWRDRPWYRELVRRIGAPV